MEENNIRVLLVDDENELVEYLSKRLLRVGFTVTATTSGAEALSVANKADFDVAVIDLKMPGFDGIETQKRLKEIRPFIETIVLTGHGSLDSALEAGRCNAFQFLEKPADHEELVKTIRDAAAQKKERKNESFREELSKITMSFKSPKEIIRAVDDLRKKYGTP